MLRKFILAAGIAYLRVGDDPDRDRRIVLLEGLGRPVDVLGEVVEEARLEDVFGQGFRRVLRPGLRPAGGDWSAPY